MLTVALSRWNQCLLMRLSSKMCGKTFVTVLGCRLQVHASYSGLYYMNKQLDYELTMRSGSFAVANRLFISRLCSTDLCCNGCLNHKGMLISFMIDADLYP